MWGNALQRLLQGQGSREDSQAEWEIRGEARSAGVVLSALRQSLESFLLNYFYILVKIYLYHFPLFLSSPPPSPLPKFPPPTPSRSLPSLKLIPLLLQSVLLHIYVDATYVCVFMYVCTNI